MSATAGHGERAHALYSASSAHRWMNCPGSVRLSQTVPVPPTSEYAALGTAAHELAEHCLVNGYSADRLIGRQFNGHAVTPDMAEHIQLYLDTVRAHARHGDLLTEHRFSLDGLQPPAPMFGTADAVVLNEAEQRLTVLDLKYGAGLAVEAEGNPQLRFYGLGALLSTETLVDTIEMVIVQPRAPHADGPVRRSEIDAFDLLDWGSELIDAAKRADAEDAPVIPGSWCRFCPAAGICSAQASKALADAQDEFGQPIRLPVVDLLTPDDVAALLIKAVFVEDWIADLRAYGHRLKERGIEVPGWKLVAKRAQRKWQDEAVALRQLAKLDGVTKKDLTKTELISPAQAEKLLGKEHKDAIAELVIAESSGTVLVPVTDKRPEIVPAASDEFDIPQLTSVGA